MRSSLGSLMGHNGTEIHPFADTAEAVIFLYAANREGDSKRQSSNDSCAVGIMRNVFSERIQKVKFISRQGASTKQRTSKLAQSGA